MQRTCAKSNALYTLTAGFWRLQDLGSGILFSKATFHRVAMQAPDAYLRQAPPIRHIRVHPGRGGRREAFKIN